jgi:hypothetical protein
MIISLLEEKTSILLCVHVLLGKCVLYSDALEDDRRAMYDAGIKTAAEVWCLLIELVIN